MTPNDRETLFDIELAPDPDATLELGPGDDNDVLSDEDVRGARLSLVRRKVQQADLGHGGVGALELECTLMPARNQRFTFAQLVVRIEEPGNVTFIDVAPQMVTQAGQYQYAYEAGGKILDFAKVAGVGHAYLRTANDVYYQHCQIRGSGGGTRRAEWRFEEDAKTQTGLGTTQALFMTVSRPGRLTCKVGLTARVAHTGTASRIRDLVLGNKLSERWHALIVDVPEL